MRLPRLVVTALLAAAPVAASGEMTCVQLAAVAEGQAHASAKSLAARPLRMTEATWSLQAQGTLVAGTLEVRFEPPGAEASPVLFAWLPAPGLRILGVEATAAGAPLALEPEAAAEGGAATGRARRTRSPGASDARRFRATLPGRADLVARFDVELDAPISSGAFRLVVAPVGSGCLGLTARPPRTSLELAVTHSGAFELVGGARRDVSVEEGAKAAILRWTDAGSEPAPAPLELAWRLSAPEEPEAVAWVRERRDGTREISVVVTAPDAPDDARIGAKDVVFVVDTSGSMSREGKLDFARKAVSECLASLRERDAMNVLAFSAQVRPALPEPAAGAPARSAAEELLGSLVPQGGTQLAPALRAALDQRREGGGRRLVVLLSDGILGDEDDVVSLLESAPADAQLLVVSVGSDARRDALRRLAELGRGEAVVVSDPSALAAIMTSLLRSFGSPVAWDLELDWGGAAVRDVRPARLTDLNAGRPVTVRAIVDGEAPSRVRVRASTVDGAGLDLEAPVEPSSFREP